MDVPTILMACLVQTVLCPHKILEDLILQLPSNTSHIKISRPSFQQHEMPHPQKETEFREKVAQRQMISNQSLQNRVSFMMKFKLDT